MNLTRRNAGLRIAHLLSTGSLFAESPAAHALFRSADGGLTWRRSDQGLPGTSRINALDSLGDTVFAGTDAGVFLSQRGAGHWRPSRDTGANRITSLAIFRQSVFAGTGGDGLLVSHDTGAAWSPVATFPHRQVRSLLAVADAIYVGDNDGQVFASREGQRWSSLSPGLPPHAQIFALASVGGVLFAGLYAKGLYRWLGREQRWTKAGSVSPLVLASGAGVLIAGHNPGGLHWSADLGETWTPAVPAANGEPSSSAPVWAAAANDRIALAGASAGIFVSKDHGRTWRRAHSGLPAECPGISFLVRDEYVLAASIIPH